MKIFGSMVALAVFFGVVSFLGEDDKKITTFVNSPAALASVFFTQGPSVSELRTAFDTASSTKKKLSILIVPGHEPSSGGTEYRYAKERDLNADLASYLAQYLVEDGHYNVVTTRGKDGWNPNFQNYFTTHDKEIGIFARSQKEGMARLVGEGKIVKISDTVPHNDAPDDVAQYLFGINKWANDTNVDIVIHIHFNDSSPRRVDTPGEYNGFAIYTPEHQYSNSKLTNEIAQSIFKRLSKMFPVSNFPVEDRGIVEDQDLIAVGSSNSVDAASMLIEYGYIYEPQLQVSSTRKLIIKELAFQTYLGLADFFGENSLAVGSHESTLLPYGGTSLLRKTTSPSREVLAFQVALSDKGFYPPQYYTKNECPLSGLFGSCTREALSVFQRVYNIKGEKGIVGAKTRAQLQALFRPALGDATRRQ